jgi:predicted Zn-ribbon and HTH transcriptional regulator
MTWEDQCEWAALNGYRPVKCATCGTDIFVREEEKGPHYCDKCKEKTDA